jgi:hypothetical protein
LDWARRLQPYLGIPMLALGGWLGLLMLERGVPAQGVAPALIGVGGLMMIAKSTHGPRRLAMLTTALALSLTLYALS